MRACSLAIAALALAAVFVGCPLLLSDWTIAGSGDGGDDAGTVDGGGIDLAQDACTPSDCTQQVTCSGNGTTSVSGVVYAPNGTLPIYGAQVFVPNAIPAAPALYTPPPFPGGVTCDQCSGTAGANALITTTTAPDGSFMLTNVPVSSSAPGKVSQIPFVIQLGRWRKVFYLTTTACVTNTSTVAQTSLPRKKSEGDIPLTAIATGSVDALECVLKKIGIDTAEFGNVPTTGGVADPGKADGPRIQIYQSLAHDNNNKSATFGQDLRNGARIDTNTPDAHTLYGNSATLNKYDVAIFGCIGQEERHPSIIAKADIDNLVSYANAGGRVYATHFSYTWLDRPYNGSDTATSWRTTGAWSVGQGNWDPDNTEATINVNAPANPKGQAFADWLANPPSALNTVTPATILISEPRHDINRDTQQPNTQQWLTRANSPQGGIQTDGPAPLFHYTFNTPYSSLTTPPAQCGRAMFSDFHVTTGTIANTTNFPNECSTGALIAQEKVLAFFLFDLASCI